jgi:hypothetical protein
MQPSGPSNPENSDHKNPTVRKIYSLSIGWVFFSQMTFMIFH